MSKRKNYNLFHPFLGLDQTGHSFVSSDKMLYKMQNLVFVGETDLSTEGIGYTPVVTSFGQGTIYKGHAQYTPTQYLLSNTVGLFLLDVENTDSPYSPISYGFQDSLLSSSKLNNDLIVSTTNNVYQYDGTTFSVLGILGDAGLTSTTAACLQVYNNRMLYAGLDKDPDSILVSDLNNALVSDVTGTNDNDGFIVTVDPQNTGGIVGVNVVYEKGTNKQYAVVFKRNAVYLLSGDTEATVSVVKVYEGYGTYNNRTHQQVGSDVYFINEQGLFSLSSTVETGNMQVDIIQVRLVQDLFDKVKARPEDAELVLSTTERELWVTVPNSTTIDGVLVFSYDRRMLIDSSEVNVPYWTYLKPYNFRGIHTISGVTYGFDKAGRLFQLRTGNTFDGALPRWKLSFKDLDFGHFNYYKQVDIMNIVLKCYSYPNIVVNWQWREGSGVNAFSHTISPDDPMNLVMKELTIPATVEDRNTVLQSLLLPIASDTPATGKYFYGWAEFNRSRYALADKPHIPVEYNNSYYGSASYINFKNNVLQFPLRFSGMGQMVSLSLTGTGEEHKPTRIIGSTMRVNVGQVSHRSGQ